MSTHTTGIIGELRTLPTGWATVTIFPYGKDTAWEDVAEDYTGPILIEDDRQITVEIGGDPFAFAKSRVAWIRRAA